MRDLLKKQISLAWLLLMIIAVGAVGIIVLVVERSAPLSNAVLIESAQDATPRPSAAPTHAIARQAEPSPTVPAVAALAPSPTEQTAIPTPTVIGDQPTPTRVDAPSPTPQMIAVFVTGAVVKPGVYNLPEGARVADAVAAAGGLLPEADLEQINLAERVSDEEHISVRAKGEAPIAVEASTPGQSPRPGQPTPRPSRTPPAAAQHSRTPTPLSKPAGKVNINTATTTELETLPYVGPSLAGHIVDYRAKNGPFQKIEDLMNVPGIKEGLFAKIRDYVTVGP